MVNKLNRRLQRKTRTRTRISEITQRPRLSVFRSNKHISAQIIDDAKGVTLVAVSDMALTKSKKDSTGSKIVQAQMVGLEIASKAKTHKISKIVFDRGPYKYHGRVKALADGARKGGLSF
jgi:large subunit ribosomal protein L18